MQKDHIVLTYSNQQKWELQGLMSYINKLPDAKFSLSKNGGEQLKQDIMSYFREAKRQLEDKNSALEWINDFFMEKQCFARQTGTSEQIITKDIIYESIKRLRTYVSQKQRDSECYKIYAAIFSELDQITLKRIGELEDRINKSYKVMSFMQRDKIAKIARRLATARDIEAKVNSLEQIMLIASKIMRYGFGQQFKQLQRIQDDQIKNKFTALLSHLQQNYLEIDSMYNRQNSLKEFIAQLSNNIYSKEEINKKLKSIHPKAKNVFEPVVAQIFNLRSTSDATNFTHRYSQTGFQKKKVTNSNEEDLKQLLADFEVLKTKKDQLENELNDMRWIITAISRQDGRLPAKDAGQVTEYLYKYHLEQFSAYLQRTREREKQLKRLIGEQSKEVMIAPITAEQESVKIRELKEEIKKYKEENQLLSHKNYQTIQQRIQMLNRIESLEGEIISKTTLHNSSIQQLQQRIELYQNTIDSLKEKCEHLTQSLQNNNACRQQLNSELADARGIIECLQTQNCLYEKTITDLQKQKVEQVCKHPIAVNKQSSQRYIYDELIQQKMEQFQRIISQKDLEISLLKQQKEELNDISKQMEVELVKVKEIKDLQIKGLRYQLEVNQRKRLNDSTNELSQQILELASRNEQLAQEIQQLIEAKESAQALTKSIHEIKQQSEKENNKLKQSLGELSKVEGHLREENDTLQKELQEIKTQIIALVDKHQIALQKIQCLQKKEQEFKDENKKLKREINQLKDATIRQSEQTSTISNEEYMHLQNSCLQLSKFNQLIKTEYLNYKSQVSNVIKMKVLEQTQKYIQNENKLKDSYKKLHEYFLIQREKLYSLKKENQSIKSSRSSFDSLQSSHQNHLKTDLDVQIKLRELKIKYECLQAQQERERQEKQAQLARKQLHILKLEQELEAPQINKSVYQLVPLKERIKWLQIQLQEQQNTITFLKVQIEKKQQEIARFKSQGPPFSYQFR